MELIIRVGGDITIKSDRVRARFMQRLRRNLIAGLQRSGARGKVVLEWTRLRVIEAGPEAAEVVRRTFGVASYSPVLAKTAADLEAIVAAGGPLFSQAVAGKSFAVRSRRTGKHSFSSMDVARQLGSALVAAGGEVDLSHPEVEVFVDVRGDEALFYEQRFAGPGGLPLGVAGRALVLLSGGFDSVVAAWRMQKRGIETDYLFCNLAGSSHARSVIKVAHVLWQGYGHGTRPRVYTVDFRLVADAIREHVKPSHSQIILKRQFYKVGAALAERKGYEALITGECISQVSSQTMTNLATISEAIRTPIFRPLISYDKDEIIRLARRIGTFAISATVTEYCQLVPDKPVTACRLESALEQEARLPPLQEAIKQSLEVHDLRTFRENDSASVFVEDIPAEAQLLDCRDEIEREEDPIAGSDSFPIHQWEQQLRRLPKKQTYLLFCGLGYQSAIAAEKMQHHGYEAYSLRGGTVRLKKLMQPT